MKVYIDSIEFTKIDTTVKDSVEKIFKPTPHIKVAYTLVVGQEVLQGVKEMELTSSLGIETLEVEILKELKSKA